MTCNESKKCSSCKYSGTVFSSDICCNYFVINRKMRGCTVEKCDKYEKGSRISLAEELPDYDFWKKECKYDKGKDNGEAVQYKQA